MPRSYSNSLRWCVITRYDCTQNSFRFQYRLLTLVAFSEIAISPFKMAIVGNSEVENAFIQQPCQRSQMESLITGLDGCEVISVSLMFVFTIASRTDKLWMSANFNVTSNIPRHVFGL